MLLLKHSAGSSGSCDIAAPNPDPCPCQEPAAFSASRAGFAAAPSLTGGSSTASTQICCERGRGGGVEAGKLLPPRCQQQNPYPRGSTEERVLGRYLTQRNGFKSSTFKVRAIGNVSLRQSRSSGQRGSQNLEGKRWGSPPRRRAAHSCPSLGGFLGQALPQESGVRQLQKHHEHPHPGAGTPHAPGGVGVPNSALSSRQKQKAKTWLHLPRAVGNLKRKGGRGRVGGSGLQCKSASPRAARLPTSGKNRWVTFPRRAQAVREPPSRRGTRQAPAPESPGGLGRVLPAGNIPGARHGEERGPYLRGG